MSVWDIVAVGGFAFVLSACSRTAITSVQAPSDLPWFVDANRLSDGNWFRYAWPLLDTQGTMVEGDPEIVALLAKLQQIERGMSVVALDALLGEIAPVKVSAGGEWEARTYIILLDEPLSARSASFKNSAGVDLSFRVLLWKGQWVAAVETWE